MDMLGPFRTRRKVWLQPIKYLSQKTEIDKPGNDHDLIITDKFSQLKDDYAPSKYPVVLCHGFMGFDTLSFIAKPKFLNPVQRKVGEKVEEVAENIENLAGNLHFINLEYWYGIKRALELIGTKVFIAKVPAFGTIEERAVHLEKFIDQKCEELRQSESKASIYNKKTDNTKNNESFQTANKPIKLNLVSHSMGGLDARYLISKLQHKSQNSNYKVVSLTTVATPHHGSECADFFMDTIKPLSLAYPKCIEQLTTSYLKEFNQQVKDDPHVAYFSYGARMKPKWFNVFTPTWAIIKSRIGGQGSYDNDGLVSVESSKWGEYLGTLDNVDHLDLINWTNKLRKAVDEKVFNSKPNFNPVALYLDLIDNLNKRGF